MHQETQKKPPERIRPLLWSLNWNSVDVFEDKDDIILAVVNEGTLADWRWLADTYGKYEIRRVLEHHLVTEFHPESRNLARLFFDVSQFQHARTSAH